MRFLLYVHKTGNLFCKVVVIQNLFRFGVFERYDMKKVYHDHRVGIIEAIKRDPKTFFGYYIRFGGTFNIRKFSMNLYQ
jgi:hypothetical protein